MYMHQKLFQWIIFVLALVMLMTSCKKYDDHYYLQQAIQNERTWNLSEALTSVSAITHLKDPEYIDLKVRLLLKTGQLGPAEDFLHEIPDTVIFANPSLLFSASQIYFFLGELEQSAGYANRLIQIGMESNDTLQLARGYYLKGRISFNRGDLEESTEYQIKSLTAAESVESPQTIADALRQLGVLEWYRSNHRTALDRYLEPALHRYRLANDKMGEASTLANIGLIRGELGESKESVELNLQAYQIRHEIGDRIGLSDSNYFLSNLLSIPGAEDIFSYLLKKRSLEISLESGYAWGTSVAARALLSDSFVAFRYGTGYAMELDSLSANLGDGFLYFWQEKANRAIRNHEFESAILYAGNQISVLDSLGFNAGLIHAHRMLGEAYLKNNQPENAAEQLEIALKLIQGAGTHFTYPLVKYYWALALYQTGQAVKATDQLEMLLDEMDNRYISYITRSSRQLNDYSYLSYISKRYEMAGTYALWMQKAGREDQVFRIAERIKSGLFWWAEAVRNQNLHQTDQYSGQKVVDLIHEYLSGDAEKMIDGRYIVEITKLLHNDIDMDDHSIQPIPDFDFEERKGRDIGNPMETSDEKQSANSVPDEHVSYELQHLQPHEKYIHYIIAGDAIIVTVKSDSGYHSETLHSTAIDLTSVIENYSKLILRGKTDPRDTLWVAPSKYLSELLIEPLIQSSVIKPGDHLYISPDDILSKVPFHSLLIDKGSEGSFFLIEDYVITLFSTISQFNNAIENEWKGTEENQRVKNSDFIKNMTGDVFAPNPGQLPHTKTEIDFISGMMSTVQSHAGKSANKSRFMQSIRESDMVHFAGHVSIDPYLPYNSSIYLADGHFSLFDILGIQSRAELVVLSACETGPVMLSNGLRMDTSGFARAFLLLGVKNVIASYWLVEDRATAELMNLFYANLIDKTGQGDVAQQVSIALRQAQIAVINQNEASYDRSLLETSSVQQQGSQALHPFYWAAFTHTR